MQLVSQGEGKVGPSTAGGECDSGDGHVDGGDGAAGDALQENDPPVAPHGGREPDGTGAPERIEIVDGLTDVGVPGLGAVIEPGPDLGLSTPGDDDRVGQDVPRDEVATASDPLIPSKPLPCNAHGAASPSLRSATRCASLWTNLRSC